MSFQYPTNSTALDHVAQGLNPSITKTVQPFLVNPDAGYAAYDYNGVDIGVWYNGTAYLLLVAHLNATMNGNSNSTAGLVVVPWSAVGLGAITNVTQQVQRIYAVGQNYSASGVDADPGGIGVYTATPPPA